MKPKRHRHVQRSRTYYLSSYLFATPTWKEGAGRLFDFGDALTEYNSRPSPDEADIFAMWLDWRAVGEDIKASMEDYARQFDNTRYERTHTMPQQSWSLIVENVEGLRRSFEARSPGLWSRSLEQPELSQRGSKRPGAR